MITKFAGSRVIIFFLKLWSASLVTSVTLVRTNVKVIFIHLSRSSWYNTPASCKKSIIFCYNFTNTGSTKECALLDILCCIYTNELGTKFKPWKRVKYTGNTARKL